MAKVAHPPARGGSLGPRGAPSPLRHRRGAAAAAARPKSPGFHWASATHARLVCSLHALYSPTNYTHSTYYGRPGEAAFRHRFLGRAAHSFVIGAPGHARAFVGFTLVPLRTRTQPVLQVSRAPGGTCTCRLPPTRCAHKQPNNNEDKRTLETTRGEGCNVGSGRAGRGISLAEGGRTQPHLLSHRPQQNGLGVIWIITRQERVHRSHVRATQRVEKVIGVAAKGGA